MLELHCEKRHPPTIFSQSHHEVRLWQDLDQRSDAPGD